MNEHSERLHFASLTKFLIFVTIASKNVVTIKIKACGVIRLEESVVTSLTAKNDKYACAFAEQIIAESRKSDKWYGYFDEFAALLYHPKSLVRNRALHIIAANVQWDEACRFDAILPEYLSHVTDEKPVTARQCIQALAEIGTAKPRYAPDILSCLQGADLSKYKDSMRPLIEKDIAVTVKVLEASV